MSILEDAPGPEMNRIGWTRPVQDWLRRLRQRTYGWDDAIVNVSGLRTVGSGVPAFGQVGNTNWWGLTFSDEGTENNEKRVIVETQLPHSVRRGTEIRFHIHYCLAASAVAAGGANVKWRFYQDTLNRPGQVPPSQATLGEQTTLMALHGGDRDWET